MALIGTKIMTRQNESVDWYDLNVVPPRFEEFYPGLVELSSEETEDGLVRTDITSWPDVDTWDDSWDHEEEWAATYAYWTANQITVTWQLVDDSTGVVLDSEIRGHIPT